jgi:hypothetical protein
MTCTYSARYSTRISILNIIPEDREMWEVADEKICFKISEHQNHVACGSLIWPLSKKLPTPELGLSAIPAFLNSSGSFFLVIRKEKNASVWGKCVSFLNYRMPFTVCICFEFICSLATEWEKAVGPIWREMAVVSWLVSANHHPAMESAQKLTQR